MYFVCIGGGSVGGLDGENYEFSFDGFEFEMFLRCFEYIIGFIGLKDKFGLERKM